MIYYHKGCAIEYAKELALKNPVILMHGCNNIGAWGSGFVLAINKHWLSPRNRFLERSKIGFNLGEVDYVKVQSNLWVANCVTQNNCGVDHLPGTSIETCPFKYDALVSCCLKVNNAIKATKNPEVWSVVMPKIGAGLGGGNWTAISRLIEDCLETPTYVCEF